MERRGARAELVAALRDIADGCLASERLAVEAAEGADRLETGADTVRVGHVLYEATDAP